MEESTSTVDRAEETTQASTAEDAAKILDPGRLAAERVAKTAPEADREGHLEPDVEKDVVDAGDWLLGQFHENVPQVTRDVDLNVGSVAEPKWIKWVIKTVPGPELRSIRARAAERMASAGGKNAMLTDSNTAVQANIEIIVAGTLSPDIRKLSSTTGLGAPDIFVEEAFKQKPGLIDIVSAAIMELSGYDDAAMRDSMEVAAAGNSPG